MSLEDLEIDWENKFFIEEVITPKNFVVAWYSSNFPEPNIPRSCMFFSMAFTKAVYRRKKEGKETKRINVALSYSLPLPLCLPPSLSSPYFSNGIPFLHQQSH